MATPITIRPLTEADIPQQVSLIRYSFYDANDACNRIMYPHGVTPAYLSFFQQKGLEEFRNAPPTKFYLGAFASNPASGEEVMLATAIWVLEDSAADTAAGDASHAASGVISTANPPPDTNMEAFDDFHGRMERCRPKVMAAVGGKYWHLSILATATEYARRGAGSALVAWGVERADAEGRMAYLDATQMGRTLYPRWGFREVEKLMLDGSRWGTDQVGYWYAMVREVGGKAVGADGGLANGAPH